MTSLNKLFTKYFVITIAIVLILVTIMSNFTASLFFKNFIKNKNDQQNTKIVESIKEMLNNKTIPDNAYPVLMAMISRQEEVHLILYSGNKIITSTYSGTLDPLVTHSKDNKSEQSMKANLSDEMEYLDYEIGKNQLLIGRAKDPLFDMANADFIRTLNVLYAVAFIVALMIAFFSAHFLSRIFNKPIMQLKNNVKHISMNRFDQLGECNTKAVELKELSQNISNLAVQRQKEENMRKRLSSDIAHELQTPISVLYTNIEAILDGIYEADEKRLSVLLSQIKRLSRLVNRVSELTILETEYENIPMEKLNLSTVLENIHMIFLPAANEKGIAFNEKIENNLYIKGNEDKLLQLFGNLLSNAIKYTESSGVITISGYTQNNNVICKISDTGIGIDEKDIPFVFNRFYRGDESRSRKTGGSGIGLTIVKAIVSAHGGEIKLESKKELGTEVIVSFNMIK